MRSLGGRRRPERREEPHQQPRRVRLGVKGEPECHRVGVCNWAPNGRRAPDGRELDRLKEIRPTRQAHYRWDWRGVPGQRGVCMANPGFTTSRCDAAGPRNGGGAVGGVPMQNRPSTLARMRSQTIG